VRPTLLAVVAAAVCAAAALAQPPAGKEAERWLRVITSKGARLIRVAGGSVAQLPTPAPDVYGLQKWIPFAANGDTHYGFPVGDGKRLIYRDDDWIANRGKKLDDNRGKLFLADRDGSNPKLLLAGLPRNTEIEPGPDGTAVYCGAEQDGKWHLFRVPIDGSGPVRVSRTPGLASPTFRVLPDGRVVYMPATGWHVEKVAVGTWTTVKGPVLLTDGKTETVLVKEARGRLPEVSDDATRVAVAGRNDAGDHVVEVTEVKSGDAKQYRVKAFHQDWTCGFGDVKFSPDGRALAVTFSLGNVVFRQHGPIPGDEAVKHVGVIWLDGRRDRTRLIELDAGIPDHVPAPYRLAWAAPPPTP
jgi:hypothetical protein